MVYSCRTKTRLYNVGSGSGIYN